MEQITHSSQVAANARAEIAYRRLRQAAISDVLGLSQQALSRRLNGEVEFSAGELQRLADLLAVPITALYAPREAAS